VNPFPPQAARGGPVTTKSRIVERKQADN